MAVYATHPAWGQPAPEWLSLQQAAAIYGVSVDTLRRRISAGKLPASRFGVRLIRVRAEDLDRRPTHSHRRRTRQAAPILTGAGHTSSRCHYVQLEPAHAWRRRCGCSHSGRNGIPLEPAAALTARVW